MGESWNKSFHRRAMGDVIINSADITLHFMLFFFFFNQATGLKNFIVVSSYDQAALVNILTIRPLHFVQTRIPACDHIVILLTLLLITCQRERESFVCVLKCWIYWTQLYLTKTIEDNEWKQ